MMLGVYSVIFLYGVTTGSGWIHMDHGATAQHGCLQIVEKLANDFLVSVYCVCKCSQSFFSCFLLIFQGLISNFPLHSISFVSASYSLIFPLFSFQECIECPYLCPCKQKGETAAEVEFLCRSQADRPHHTLVSGQPGAKMALRSLTLKSPWEDTDPKYSSSCLLWEAKGRKPNFSLQPSCCYFAR